MRLGVWTIPFVVLALGCSKSTEPDLHSQPSFDPDALTTAALAALDTDKNGTLEPTELGACPALYGALAGVDTNRDGKISTAELRTRFAEYAAAKAGTISVTATVTLDGNPMPDATVQFVPEAFMGGAIKEASGKTGPDGTVSTFTSGGTQYAGLQPGLYKVKITRDGTSLPARYNAQTALGYEVFGGRGSRPATFALTSR